MSEEMSILEISNAICRDHRVIKKVVGNITKLKTWSKGKGLKNVFPWDKCRQNWIWAKQPLLTGAQIFKKAASGGIKRTKSVEYFVNLDLLKNIQDNLLSLKKTF